MIGQTISHYKVIKKIGEGGMGIVYLVQDNNLQRQCALKLLSPKSGFNPAIKRRFKREAQAISILNHPNIITIFELGEYNEIPYIIMEYAQGESLREILEKEKKLEIRRALNIIKQIANGLSKAHFAGIVHRDLKPENILIDDDQHVKILDFGLAKLKGTTSITKESSMVGTIQYMSPEQVQGLELDTRSDIFSLGVIFYEIVTGILPFKGEYDVAVMYSILNESPVPFKDSDLLPLQEILNKTIDKDVTMRYQTAEVFLDDVIAYERQHLNIDIKNIVSQINPPNQSIEELLAHREKIDALIEKEHKKNIVIMFCDIAGSTNFFEQFGDIEGRAMVKRFTSLAFPTIKSFNGRVIKTMGDGILASFDDPFLACDCAIDLQNKLLYDNEQKETQNKILIRIAMHYGKVVIDQNDVYGDVVNVAARVESKTKARQIFISEPLFQKVKAKTSLEFSSAGKFDFKGKSEPVKLFRLRWNENESLADQGELNDSQKRQSALEEIVIKKKYTTPLPEFGNTSQLSKNKNPYMNRVMIRENMDFFGRKKQITKIYSRIGSARPQSVSIVGERRIGKSSLLNFIYNPMNRRKFLKEPDKYIFIFVDFQENRGIDSSELFATFFNCLINEFRGQLEINLTPEYESFEKVVAFLDGLGYKLILLFDEFELVTRNTNFKAEFYSYARSLANNYNVAYVVASGRSLQSVCHSKEISDSPFFNIFSNINLGPFTREEQIDLVVVPSKRAGYPMDSFVDFVYDLAGYYPFFIQMACAPLFEFVKERGHLSKQLLENIKEEFLDEAQVHFQQIWDVYDDEYHSVLLRLAAKEQILARNQDILNNLYKSGYVKGDINNPEIFSSVFGHFILERYGKASTVMKKSKFSFWPFNK